MTLTVLQSFKTLIYCHFTFYPSSFDQSHLKSKINIFYGVKNFVFSPVINNKQTMSPLPGLIGFSVFWIACGLSK